MQSRTVKIHRAVLILLGLPLLLAGLMLIGWATGLLERWSTDVPDEIPTDQLVDAAGQSWWGWALGGAGLALTLLGFWWLLSHRPAPGVKALEVQQAAASPEVAPVAGSVMVETGALRESVRDQLAAIPGVKSANAAVVEDRGQLVLDATATMDPDADLAAVARATDEILGGVTGTLGRNDLATRVQLRVAGKSALPRVR